ncbi:MAG TPA: SDR family oxidoreductase [Pyrinomonadaceae bacterium]|jgi:3-oxoacyl-[acyl-carrier protein] reductase|nr:SDR family oxidoreductase [Pyrinomonadaceae bacterium]
MPDRSVLITGIAGEIGGYLAGEFLKDGWNVCGLDLRPPVNLDRAGFSFQECDLSDGTDVERKIEVFHERFGAFDAVVNCAGHIANSPLISLVEGRLVHHDFGLWDRVLSSCLSSAFHVTACTVLKMAGAGKRGVIVNISSICSRGNPGQVAYSAAKAGLNGLTATLAKELGPFGIRVVALAPGYFDTASTRHHVDAAKLKEIRASVPLRRLGNVEEVSSAVRFILTNQYVNGTVIELDGGQVL